MNKEFRVKLAVDDGELTTGFDRADARVARFAKELSEQMSRGTTGLQAEAVRQAAAGSSGLSKVAANLASVSNGSKLTRQEMLTLNYTLSDVAASLASGASPFTILLQQGGQVKDAFGGIGPLFAKLGAAVSPVTLAVGALAATVGVLGTAAYQGYEEQNKLNSSLVLTGNYAALTNDRLRDMARNIAVATSESISTTREMITGLAATGKVAPEVLQTMATAAVRFARISGQSSEEVIQKFSGMSAGVSRWAADADKSYHFLSAAQLKYIQELEEQGNVSRAALETNRLLFEHMGGLGAQNVGILARALRLASNAWSEFWDSAKGNGRDATFSDQIADLQSKIDKARSDADVLKRQGFKRASEEAGSQADDLQKQLLGAERARLETQAAANTRAARQGMEDRAKAAQAAIDKLQDETKGQSALTKELEKYKRNVADLAAVGRAPSAAQQQADMKGLQEKFNPKAAAQANTQQNAVQRRLQSLGEERAAWPADCPV
jgi:phage-related minor tail protein